LNVLHDKAKKEPPKKLRENQSPYSLGFV